MVGSAAEGSALGAGGRSARGIRAAIAAGLTLAAGAGSFSVGRSFPTEPLTRIQVGDTTRDDVRRWFGPPWRTGIEDGAPTWTYGQYRYALLGPARTRDLVLRFDDTGVVSSFTFNSTEPGDLGGADPLQ